MKSSMESGSEDERNRKSKKCKRQMKTPHQLRILEKTYAAEKYPSEETKAMLSEDLGLTDRQLQMWFCHRRLKDKNENASAKRLPFLKSYRQKVMAVDRGDDSESDHGSPMRSSHEELLRSRSRSRSRSGSGWESDSSQSNEPLEAANILGQIASQKPLAQTLTPAEIDSRIEKEVQIRVACHIDKLRVEMEEMMQEEMDEKEKRMQVKMNAKLKRMRAEMEKMKQMLENSHRT